MGEDKKTVNGINRYKLSFSAGGLLRQETIRLASLWLKVRDWAKLKALVFDENVLQFKTDGTRKRIFPELRARIETLNDEELRILTTGTLRDEDQILWLAICRRYEFIADFARQVLRERYLMCQAVVDHADYDYFVEQASILHPELQEITAATAVRLRAALFCILRDCSFLDEENRLCPALLSDDLIAILKSGDPAEIALFPTFQKVV